MNTYRAKKVGLYFMVLMSVIEPDWMPKKPDETEDTDAEKGCANGCAAEEPTDGL